MTTSKAAAPNAAAAARAAAVPDRARHQEPDLVVAEAIAGVRFRRLAGHEDHRGALIPFFDANDPFWAEPVVWGYEYTIRPGRIKGWGMHRRQADRYFIVAGNLRVVLFDGREDSPTQGNFCPFYVVDGGSALLLIPPGVWHATQNWGTAMGRVVNFPTVAFDPADPDKARIDPHAGIIPFDWELRDG